MFKTNDTVKSKKTGKVGIIQGTYPNDLFLMYHGNGYEHLKTSEMENTKDSELTFRKDLYEVET